MSTGRPTRRTSHNLMLFFGSNGMRTALMMVVGFILTPLQISAFGFALFGLYMLVQGFIYAVMSPIHRAATGTLVKAITAHRAGGSGEVVRQFASAVALLAGLGILMLLVAVLVIIFAPSVIEFPPDLTEQVRFIVGCVAIIIAANVATSPWLSMFLVEERPLAYNADLAILRSIELIAFGAAFLIPGGVLFVNFLILRMVFSLIHFLCRVLRVMKMTPEARFRISSVDRSCVHSHAKLLSLTASQPFANFNFFVIDNYFMNFVFGPIYNGIYAIVTQLRGYARRIGSEAYSGMEAVSSNIHESGLHGTNIKAMLSVIRITCGVMLVCTAVVAIFFEPLIDLWLGSRLRNDEGLASVMPWREAVDLAWAMLSMLLVGGVLLEVATAGSRFLFGMGLVKRYAGIMYGAGAVKFIAAVAIACWILMGSEGDRPPIQSALLFPASTLCVQVIFFGILFPRRLVSVTDIGWSTYLHHALIRPVLVVLGPAIVGLLAVWWIQDWNWILLGAALACVGAVSALSILGLLLVGEERARVFELIHRRNQKRADRDEDASQG